MKNIILFDTSIGTMNQGDNIIMDSIDEALAPIIKTDCFITRFPTHIPCFTWYQLNRKNDRYLFVKNADYKFLCATNLLHNKMFFPWPTWNINIMNYDFLKGAIAVGVGCSGYGNGKKPRGYSSMLYKNILSDSFIHSVRDDATMRVLESLGKKAINTGCPTMWGLTESHCAGIPTGKQKNAVFTITDYSKDPDRDLQLINGLLRNYKQVYFWPQGLSDIEYLKKIAGQSLENITILSPTVKAFSDTLRNSEVDYFGTRLHAGIYAMQHQVRTMIIAVDNRARDINDTYNINMIERVDLDNIDDICNKTFETRINIDTNAIELWRSQFI